ncbi:hypothetical protein [Streptomyces griseoloalbus]|uniref:hypothetical protein n=1 Tax=Streptomyces griseoloalbus TaxID=67303 RepID=UPI001414FBE5|nr:hypothetical protein [Streptomyces albaduncus]
MTDVAHGPVISEVISRHGRHDDMAPDRHHRPLCQSFGASGTGVARGAAEPERDLNTEADALVSSVRPVVPAILGIGLATEKQDATVGHPNSRTSIL